jgi:hypothetical protein
MTNAEHINQLLLVHSINVTWRRGTSGRAWKKSRKVRLSPIATGISYAVALHEIGHIVGKQPKLRLDREIAAWEWAKENAQEWTEVMENKMNRCLGSYARSKKRYKSTMSFDAWMSGGFV